MTQLCVAIFARDVQQVQAQVAAAAEAGADMIELRVDNITDSATVSQMIQASSLPAIVTCRPTWEGGHCQLEESQRLMLLREAAHHSAYIDIELKALAGIAGLSTEPRTRRSGVICSSHDFATRPAKLYQLLSELNDTNADVAKIVWTARSIRDNLEAFEILLNRAKPTIALCMGEAGIISRILAKKFGAFLTFACLGGDQATAPGQVSLQDMKHLYRWDAIGQKTRVYGVVAQPVMHSMSPAIHNAAFDAVNHDGVYLPLLVEGSYESFKAFMETFTAMTRLDLSGLSITLPHKENALRYLGEKGAHIEPLAKSIGAVNTIALDRCQSADGNQQIQLRGLNTDYAAILDCITERLNIQRQDLSKYQVAVIGAGGTGRTAVAGLAHYGAQVTIYNRNLDRAQSLADEFDQKIGSVNAAPLTELKHSRCQIYFHATSVGMYPKSEGCIFDENCPALNEQSLVFDSIYNPIETRLLKLASSQGAKTISGVEMFVRQAVSQFETWTGRTAPMQIMRQVVISRLTDRS